MSGFVDCIARLGFWLRSRAISDRPDEDVEILIRFKTARSFYSAEAAIRRETGPVLPGQEFDLASGGFIFGIPVKFELKEKVVGGDD